MLSLKKLNRSLSSFLICFILRNIILGTFKKTNIKIMITWKILTLTPRILCSSNTDLRIRI